MGPVTTGPGREGEVRGSAQVVEEAPLLGLALGGGGGKGGAHLGVLATLEEIELPIDRIAGTSIGGLVGILYAAGHSVDAIERAMSGQSLRQIVERDPAHLGLSGNAQIRALLTTLLGKRTFADLAIPAAVMATDLVTGRPVVLERGSLVEAVLATVALPGLFPPIARDGLLLADGGIVDNLPIGAARALGAHKVIAVALDTAGDDFAFAPAHDGLLGWLSTPTRQPLALADRALTLLLAQQTRQRLARTPPELLLVPEIATIGTLELGRIAEGRAAGSRAAQDALGALYALRAWRGTTPNRRASAGSAALASIRNNTPAR